MATVDGVKAKLQGLIDNANQTTGGTDTNLTDAMTRLREGYGKGAMTQPLSVVENGYYVPPEGVDGFSSVDVNVDASAERAEGYNEGYAVGRDEGYSLGYSDGQGSADPQQAYDQGYAAGRDSLILQDKTVTANGTVTPDTGYDGLSSVVVNVPAGGDLRLVMDQGTYQVGSKIFDGESLAVDLLGWATAIQQIVGQEICYMPANITLPVNDGLVFINGAFIVDDPTADNCVIYFAGNDITASYQLEMVIDPNTQQITGLSFTKNDTAMDISGGLFMGMTTYAFVVN